MGVSIGAEKRKRTKRTPEQAEMPADGGMTEMELCEEEKRHHIAYEAGLAAYAIVNNDGNTLVSRKDPLTGAFITTLHEGSSVRGKILKEWRKEKNGVVSCVQESG